MRAVALLFHDVFEHDPAESGFASNAADRYKLAVSDFDGQLAGVEAVRSDVPMLSPGILRRMKSEHGLAPFLITVDDGGVAYARHIADRLERRDWRGHCFVTTNFIGHRGFLTADQIRDLDARGHVIGSHSASHPPRFRVLPFDQMVAEWSRSRRTLEDIVGHAVEVASVPGGYFSPKVAQAASEAGIRVLFTSEPVTRVDRRGDCIIVGRFTIRRGDPPDTARRFVSAAPWTRTRAWAGWNAKGLVKPLLGPSYVRVANWLLTPGRFSRAS